MNTALSMGLVLAALSALFIAARSFRSRGILSGERARKAVHVGMGLVCLSFPWLFQAAWPVLVLAAVATVGLLALRFAPRAKAQFGCVLHEVDRPSWGEFAFIAGIATAFVLASGSTLVYVIPVAVLTFADPVAALVGSRFGTHRFATHDGTKSIEGSGAFLLCALACVAVPLVVVGDTHALVIAATTAVTLMLIEACSWGGFDNFTIPLVGGLLVQSLFHG